MIGNAEFGTWSSERGTRNAEQDKGIFHHEGREEREEESVSRGKTAKVSRSETEGLSAHWERMADEVESSLASPEASSRNFCTCGKRSE